MAGRHAQPRPKARRDRHRAVRLPRRDRTLAAEDLRAAVQEDAAYHVQGLFPEDQEDLFWGTGGETGDFPAADGEEGVHSAAQRDLGGGVLE